MKKCALILVLLMVLSAVGCSFEKDGTQAKTVEHKEWWNAVDITSPDGVHYWLWSNGHGGQLVPRYGEDGRIMVDGEHP